MNRLALPLTRWTCTRPWAKSMASQRSVTNSAARNPCRYATSTMVASRWLWRFSPAAVIRRAISPSVRYSRARLAALCLRRGGRRRSATVPFNSGRRHPLDVVLSCFFRVFCSTVHYGPYGTLHKAKNADFTGKTAFRARRQTRATVRKRH